METAKKTQLTRIACIRLPRLTIVSTCKKHQHQPSLNPIQRLLTRHIRPPRPPQPLHLRLISFLRFLPRSLLSLALRPNFSRRRRGSSISRNQPAGSLTTRSLAARSLATSSFALFRCCHCYCVFASSRAHSRAGAIVAAATPDSLLGEFGGPLGYFVGFALVALLQGGECCEGC
jgi:hypothetical protein